MTLDKIKLRRLAGLHLLAFADTTKASKWTGQKLISDAATAL